VLRTETQIAGTLTRTALFGPDDMPTVRAIQHGYAIQRLSEYAGLRPPPPAPAPVFPVWDQQRALSADFVGYLNFLLGLVDPHPSEAALYERFAKIGIGAGRPWQPERLSADVLSAIGAGVEHGLNDIEARASHTTSSLGLFGYASSSKMTTSLALSPPTWGSTAKWPKKLSTAAAGSMTTGTS
jgi:hypothetical protein